MGQCCVELHYGNVLGSYHTSFGCYEIARKLGHNSSAKTLPLLQFDTTPIQSQAQPKNGRYTSSILTVQALRVISINNNVFNNNNVFIKKHPIKLHI